MCLEEKKQKFLCETVCWILGHTCHHELLVITTRLRRNPRRQILLVKMLIRSFTLMQSLLIPMNHHNSPHEGLVLGSQARHGRFQEIRVVFRRICSGADDEEQSILHVAGEFGFDDGLEGTVIFGLVGLHDGADLAVAARGENGADGHLVSAGFAFGGTVHVFDVLLRLLGDDGRGIFGSAGGHDHVEHAFGLHAQVALDVRLEGFAVHVLVVLFDGIHVCVGACKEDVVQSTLLGAETFDTLVNDPAVLFQRTANHGFQSFAKVARGLGVNILEQVSLVSLLVDLLHGCNL